MQFIMPILTNLKLNSTVVVSVTRLLFIYKFQPCVISYTFVICGRYTFTPQKSQFVYFSYDIVHNYSSYV